MHCANRVCCAIFRLKTSVPTAKLSVSLIRKVLRCDKFCAMISAVLCCAVMCCVVLCNPCRALNQLGVLDRARYLSSNSGGSWFNSAFSFQVSLTSCMFTDDCQCSGKKSAALCWLPLWHCGCIAWCGCLACRALFESAFERFCVFLAAAAMLQSDNAAGAATAAAAAVVVAYRAPCL